MASEKPKKKSSKEVKDKNTFVEAINFLDEDDNSSKDYGIAFRTTVEEIVKENEFTRIEQIREQLANKGIEISDFKLRRYLKDVNITKGYNKEGKKVYQTQWSPGTPTFRTQIKELVTNMRSNSNLIMIKTISGAAPFVAKVIDGFSEQLGIMGTIAGDDAVIIIPLDTEDLPHIYENIANQILHG